MVGYYKLKIDEELYKAQRISKNELIQMLTDNNIDVENMQAEIDNGKKAEISGYYLFVKRPLYGIHVGIDFPNNRNYIEIIENLDAHYLINQMQCEAVLNSKEYAYTLIESEKLMGRFSNGVVITEGKFTNNEKITETKRSHSFENCTISEFEEFRARKGSQEFVYIWDGHGFDNFKVYLINNQKRTVTNIKNHEVLKFFEHVHMAQVKQPYIDVFIRTGKYKMNEWE